MARLTIRYVILAGFLATHLVLTGSVIASPYSAVSPLVTASGPTLATGPNGSARDLPADAPVVATPFSFNIPPASTLYPAPFPSRAGGGSDQGSPTPAYPAVNPTKSFATTHSTPAPPVGSDLPASSTPASSAVASPNGPVSLSASASSAPSLSSAPVSVSSVSESAPISSAAGSNSIAVPDTPSITNTSPAAGITNAGNTAVTCWNKVYNLTQEAISQDFTFTCGNQVTFNGGVMQWTLDKACPGAGLIYGRNDIWYGRATITMKVAANSGAVTAFVRGSPGGDEIDLEWVGKNTEDTLTMYFVDGERVNGDDLGEHTQLSGTDFATTFVEYAIDFTATQIQWLMNGKVIRTLKNDPKKKYPTNARGWSMNVWNGGATSPGWAGETDWSKGPSFVEVKSLAFQSYC